MSGEDIIVGKTVTLPQDASGAVQRFTKRDASLALRGAESGVVDQVKGGWGGWLEGSGTTAGAINGSGT